MKTLVQTLNFLETEKKISHRDIKPDNILKIKNNYYISDYGVSEIKKSI